MKDNPKPTGSLSDKTAAQRTSARSAEQVKWQKR